MRRYREMREIHVTGEGIPKPVSNFEEASFPGEPLEQNHVFGWEGWSPSNAPGCCVLLAKKPAELLRCLPMKRKENKQLCPFFPAPLD